jgi:hypothetical protein
MNRSVALLVWSSTLLVPLFFGAVAEAVRGDAPHLAHNGLLFWVTMATSAACIALSQVVPQKVAPVPAGREATAFIRLVSGWALCEGAALFPLVAWIVTEDPRLLGVCAVDLLALVMLFPSEQRWERMLPGEPIPARR